MSIDLEALSEAQLLDLNRRVVARLRLLQQQRTEACMLEFTTGQRVWFEPEGRPRIRGRVSRCNKKTITVLADDGVQWKVPPAVLHKLDDMASLPRSDKIIPFRRK